MRNIRAAAQLLKIIIIVFAFHYLSTQIESQSKELQRIGDERQIVRTARASNAVGMAQTSRKLCATAAGSALCEALAARTYEKIGDHNDLWIALDAILSVLHGGDLAKPLRRELTRHVSDLVNALNGHGIYEIVTSNDQFDDMLSANDLYFAIVIQGDICNRHSNMMACQGELPIATRKALGACIRVIIRENGGANLLQSASQIGALDRLGRGRLLNE